MCDEVFRCKNESSLPFSLMGYISFCAGVASQLREAEGPQPNEIRFAAPESEEDAWDFMLFSPSPQHTAALCVQQEPAMATSSAFSRSAADTHTDESSDDAPSEGEDDRMLSHSLGSGSCDSSPGMCSTASESLHHIEESALAQYCNKPGNQCNWSLQCWRTIPFVHEKRIEPSELLIQGYSVRQCKS